MSLLKKNQLVVEENNGMVHLVLELTVKRQLLRALMIIVVLVLIALGSSLGEDTYNLILDWLIGAIQVVVFTELHPKS
jgi:hypothetical protein